MTREDAVQLLGLDGDAGASHARRRYEELFNDYRVRLSNAPTPALKRKYQATIADLEAAVALLAPDNAEATGDLPSRTPPSTLHGRDTQPPARTEPPASTANAGSAAKPVVERPVLIVLGIASVLAAGMTLFGLRWFNVSAHAKKLEAQIAQLEAKQERLAADAHRWQNVLTAGPLQVCNRSTGAAKVTAVMAMYVRPSGERVYVHSGSYGYPEWTVQGGGKTKLDILRGRDNDWDGTASVYAIQVAYPGADPFIVAGLWSDLRDGCIHFSLD